MNKSNNKINNNNNGNKLQGSIQSSRAHNRVNSFEYNVSGTSSVPILRQMSNSYLVLCILSLVVMQSWFDGEFFVLSVC
jgi:hypothetical protein